MTTAVDVTHKCLSGKNCRDFRLVEERGRQRREPALTEKPNTLCRRCAADVRRAAEDLPGDYGRLQAAMGDGPAQGAPGPRVRGTASAPIPFNTRYDALMSEIRAELVAATTRITVPPEGADAHVVTTCARAVAANVPKLLGSPALPEEVWVNGIERRVMHRSGVTIALELVNLHRRCVAALGGDTDSSRIRLSYGCASCGSPALVQQGYQVTCPSCKKDWTDNAYAELNRELVRQKEQEEMKQLEHAKLKLAALQRLNDGFAEMGDTDLRFTPTQLVGLLGDILTMPEPADKAAKK
ncbi:Uncharacterised protein [Mycobacteroides abscessus subsp. abscessus]|uniref:hypothetical protein n=1 Tax=Mycobacteroides abscessus TaxID=36809 RepID=UPI00092BFC6A|nr:hypothetical protein [Mycobacteroides abscessus]QSM03815.1 hypothetical protein PROPHIGD05-3_34 [Mycobacterium phage prophiGD05-3]MDM2350555.1 hypothetical protein [Mycobacteroides abscessus]MDM2357814.1 hypothetical protein [Mycobacteroides abscessus]QSN50899.1 hypothetical protein I3U39_19135 [Mycobacteroides abscessus subsp. abscessus]SHU92834.1 Uncharacterised protein [Mycobacteroides abscessus subsp. abscessus]